LTGAGASGAQGRWRVLGSGWGRPIMGSTTGSGAADSVSGAAPAWSISLITPRRASGTATTRAGWEARIESTTRPVAGSGVISMRETSGWKTPSL
jgi:hypothetical protein